MDCRSHRFAVTTTPSLPPPGRVDSICGFEASSAKPSSATDGFPRLLRHRTDGRVGWLDGCADFSSHTEPTVWPGLVRRLVACLFFSMLLLMLLPDAAAASLSRHQPAA
ncbi:transmembrane epididymal protein 1-like isoform 3 [Anopheles sinensis]|uniref:Transmembrane epididymal protein 1-like isoform 3 n=1 Tax=Anopheles sinensis TaxID=74873 RepID=A0A084VPD8_ANOSI|nr:transmembrane epididymal protein 1-like isoform 3 [Anopheles sinensis]